MLDRLLESKARRNRSPVGAATSIAAHLAVIVIAVHATAQSRPRPTNGPKLVVLSWPKPPTVSQTPRTSTPRGAASPKRPFRFTPVAIDPPLPSIDFTPPSATDPSDFRRGGFSTSSEPGVEVSNPSAAFRADQVERQVTVLAGAPLPDYPEALRSAGIAGSVVAEFTVDERGLVESDSVRFVRSDNVLFERSVRNVLRRMRFAPAEIGGRKVRQLVQMPFVFTLNDR